MSVGSVSLVKDIWAGSGPGIATSSNEPNVRVSLPNGTVLFAANDGTAGTELWVSDGTTAGTNRVADILPGSSGSSPGSFVQMGGVAYFTANDGAAGRELWRSDGTAVGTVPVKDILPGINASAITQLTVVGNRLFFWANDGVSGTELWTSDGTESGTQMVLDATPGATSSRFVPIVGVGSTAYFSLTDTASGAELWKSDGTAAGTALVKDIAAGSDSASPRPLALLGDALLFSATVNSNIALWRTDGTDAGTYAISDSFLVSPVGGSAFSSFVVAGDRFYFNGTSADHGSELWSTDGTLAGTAMVTDLREGATGSTPTAMMALGDSAVFAADAGVGLGREIYISDGTAAGTTLLMDISEGSGSGLPAMLGVTADGLLYFAGTNAVLGTELHVTDGTAAGTYLVADINVGKSSSPGLIGTIGNALLFSADNTTLARELYHIASPTPPAANEKPIAVITAPATATEGASVSPSASASSDPDGTIGTAQWDLNYDGVTFTLDTSGLDPTSTMPDGPATRTVALRVYDNAGRASDIVTHTITVNNAAPVLTVTGSGSVSEGSTYTVNLASTDIAADTITSWTINWGDGVIETLAGKPTTASHVYTDNSTRNIRASVTDEDGTHGGTTTLHTVNVNNIAPTASSRIWNQVVAEGETNGIISLGGFADPSSVDVSAGFRFSYDFNGDGTFEITNSSLSSVDIPDEVLADGPKSFSMRVRIADKDGSFTQYFLPVTVNNAIPGAVFGVIGQAYEGSAVTIGFTQQSDPSPIDAAAGFTYQYDLNNDGVYEISSASPTTTKAYTNNGTFQVNGRIIDKDNGIRTLTSVFTVANVAPTPYFSGEPTGAVTEGDLVSLTAHASDPSSVDTSMGFTYSWSITKDGQAFASGASNGPVTQAPISFRPDDQGDYVVTLTATDHDSATGTTTRTFQVSNAAPTAAVSGPTTAIEGSTVQFTATVDDVSTVDHAAGFTYRWTVTLGDVTVASGDSANFAFTPADQGQYSVTFVATDKDGAASTAVVRPLVVSNVGATVAITGAPSTVAEGTPVLLGTIVTDPSSADTTAGFTYDWTVFKGGTTFRRGTSAAIDFTPDDQGAYLVVVRAYDKDGVSANEATASIVVTNTAPTAVFAAVGTITEGVAGTIAFTNAVDASADTAAGLLYAFDLNGDGDFTDANESFSTAATRSYVWTDNGNQTVRGRVMDKDGAFSEYVITVPVQNAPPTATLVGPTTGKKNKALKFTLNATDPSTVDANAGYTFLIDWDGNGTIDQTVSGQSGIQVSRSYKTAGIYNVVLYARDKDGATSDPFTLQVRIA